MLTVIFTYGINVTISKKVVTSYEKSHRTYEYRGLGGMDLSIPAWVGCGTTPGNAKWSHGI